MRQIEQFHKSGPTRLRRRAIFVFAFGVAGFYGSMMAKTPNQPIVGIG